MPQCDENKMAEQTVELAIQINGKLKGTIVLDKDISREDVLAAVKTDERIVKQLEGKTIVKEIVVPGKIVNIVVR